MLHHLDETLEDFLRRRVPLPAKEVDVSFDAPDSDWGAGITKPTVNLYLWDVRRNGGERQAAMERVTDADGRPVRRPPLPRVDCRYLVTGWTTEVADEHALLGSVLACLLIHDELPVEHLQGVLEDVKPLPSLSVAAADAQDQSDFWSALGGQLKPGLDVVVTATVDAARVAALGPPVERLQLAVQGLDARSEVRAVGGRAPVDMSGATVRSPRGRARVDGSGRFLVRAEVGDQIVLKGPPKRRATVRERGAVEPKEGDR